MRLPVATEEVNVVWLLRSSRLLPVGLMQTWASVERGYWYACSPEIMQTPLMQNLRRMRVPGDTIFSCVRLRSYYS